MSRWVSQLTICATIGALTVGCAIDTDAGVAEGRSPQPSASDIGAGTTARPHASPNPWRRLALTGLEVEHYSSLKQMVRQSNVALIGTVSSAAFTQRFAESEGSETEVDRTLEVRVSVDRVLHGTVVGGADEVRIEFGPYPQAEATSELWAPLIGRRSVFVLRRKGAPVNLDPERPDELARKVYRVVCSQGLLDDTDGTTTLPMADALESFERALRGKPFDDVVAAVDAAG